MTPAWAQRQEELRRDCLVSPDVFSPMVDRLGAFVVPYQQAFRHSLCCFLQIYAFSGEKGSDWPKRAVWKGLKIRSKNF